MGNRGQLRIESLRFGARPDLEEREFSFHDLPGDSELRRFCEREGLLLDGGSVAVTAALEDANRPPWGTDPLYARMRSPKFCVHCGEANCSGCAGARGEVVARMDGNPLECVHCGESKCTGCAGARADAVALAEMLGLGWLVRESS